MENLAPLYSLTQLTMSLRGYSLSQVINGLLVFFPNLKYLDLSDSAIVDDGPDDPSQAILRASQVEELRLCRIHDSTSAYLLASSVPVQNCDRCVVVGHHRPTRLRSM